MGRITAMQQVYGRRRTTTISYTWQYDPASNVTQSYNSTDGTDTYTTDSADQLTSASLTSETTRYDQNGNPTGAGDPQAGTPIGADNRLLSDVESGTVYDYQYLCSCQPGGTDFLRPSGECLSKGSGLFSFSHKSMAA